MTKISGQLYLARNIGAFFFLLLFVMAVSASARASSLKNYRDEIRDAIASIESVVLPDDGISSEENANYKRGLINEIRLRFASVNEVEFEGQTIETDHKWLFEKLDALENSLQDNKKRRTYSREITERLSAIDAQLEKLENAQSASRTKDEDRRKLDEILSRPEFAKPEEKEEGLLQRYWRRFLEWLRSLFPEAAPIKPSTEGLSSLSRALQFILYAVVIGLIAFLLWRFLPSLVARFRNRENEFDGVRIILGEELTSDENSASLFSEAEALARQGNLRAAIRKGYIACLCELGDRKVLRLSRNKTNRDYLRDMRKRESLHRNFGELTGSFERHWYGSENASAEDWQGFRTIYERAVSASTQRD